MLNSSNISSYDEKRKKYAKEVKLYTDKGIKSFIYKILGKGNELVSTNDIIRSDAEHENSLRKSGKPDNLVFNSSLVFNEYPLQDDEGIYDFIGEISGLIDGKKVIIKYSKRHSSYSGSIEGLTIGEEDAKNIFNKFKNIALERSGRINGIYDDIIYTNKNEINKIDEERIKEKLQLQTKTYVNDILSI